MSLLKILSKENLILGGVYMAIDIPFFYANIYKVSECLCIVFLIGFLLQCFLGDIFNLEKRMISYPNVLYYLCSIGWVPYFYIGLSFLLFVLVYFNVGNENIYDTLNGALNYFSQIVIPLSLVIAFIKKKVKKQL